MISGEYQTLADILFLIFGALLIVGGLGAAAHRPAAGPDYRDRRSAAGSR